MKNIVRIIVSLFSIVSLFVISVSAASYEEDKNYTYSNAKEAIVAPTSYELFETIDKKKLGVSSLSNVADIYVYNNELYILEKTQNKIFVVDNSFDLVRTIGENLGLNAPEGFYISKEGYIYIADTGNKRVLKTDNNGVLITELEAPDAKKTLSTVEYEPSKIVVDSGERIYVIAKNETNGIYQLDISGEFLGFFGSVPVVPSFKELMWRAVSTKEQLAQMLLFVPTEYSGMDIDESGFIYTTVATNTDSEMLSYIESSGSDSTLAPIRRLNPKNIDVLVRNGSMPPAGDRIKETNSSNVGNSSRFIDLSVKSDGKYVALDSTRNRAFVYSKSGELICVFGNKNNQKDGIASPIAITWWNDNIVIADIGNKSVKIFAPTDYTKLIYSALEAETIGDYDKSLSCWEELIKVHSGNDLAYLGIGKQEMRNGNYTEAMNWFRKANSKENYSKAFKLYRKEIGYKYTGIIVVSVILILIAILLIKIILKKFKKNDTIKAKNPVWEAFKYGFYIIRHPFGGFWDMQFENKGRLSSATLILVATVVLNLVSSFTTGYLIAGNRSATYNVLLQGVLSILVPFGLWCVANWSVTSLMNGSGTFKNIYMYSCYSLTPLLVSIPLLTILSNILSSDEMMLYNILQVVAYVLVGFLLFTGTLVVHQYLAMRTVATIIVIIVAMGIMVFLLMLGVTVIQQMTDFISLIIEEINLRM